MGAGGALSEEDAHADGARARFLQGFDLAEAHYGGKFVAFADDTFGGGRAAFHRATDYVGGKFLEIEGGLYFGGFQGCCHGENIAKVRGQIAEVTVWIFSFEIDPRPSEILLLNDSAGFPLCGPADSHTIDFNCRDADADRNGLSIFAAGAHAFIEFQIVADHRNARQHIGSVADQGCALDGGRDLSVFDEIRLRRRENKFAVRDVDLSATKVHRVDAVLYRTNNVPGIILPCEHVRVGHARHRNVLVTLAASVAGIGQAHQLRGEFVAEISLQDSILDQHRFLRRLAFVVYVQRSAAPRHGTVVDHRALFAGHSFADQASECRRLLAIEVGLQPVAHGFVHQNAGPSRTEHDFHVTSRSFARVELQNGLARGLFCKKLGSLVAKKEVERHPPAAAGAAPARTRFRLLLCYAGN